MKPIVVAVLLGLLAADDALAQTVYRCGNTYSQVACAQAKALIDIDDARTPGQQAEARRVAADERRRADDMQRHRLAEARDARPAGPASLGGAPSVQSTRVEVVANAPHGKTKKKPKRRSGA